MILLTLVFSVVGACYRAVGLDQRFWPRSYRRGDRSISERADVMFAPREYILSVPSRRVVSLQAASPQAASLNKRGQIRFCVFTRSTRHTGKYKAIDFELP